jgi:hypothetical protein
MSDLDLSLQHRLLKRRQRIAESTAKTVLRLWADGRSCRVVQQVAVTITICAFLRLVGNCNCYLDTCWQTTGPILVLDRLELPQAFGPELLKQKF